MAVGHHGGDLVSRGHTSGGSGSWGQEEGTGSWRMSWAGPGGLGRLRGPDAHGDLDAHGLQWGDSEESPRPFDEEARWSGTAFETSRFKLKYPRANTERLPAPVSSVVEQPLGEAPAPQAPAETWFCGRRQPGVGGVFGCWYLSCQGLRDPSLLQACSPPPADCQARRQRVRGRGPSLSSPPWLLRAPQD